MAAVQLWAAATAEPWAAALQGLDCAWQDHVSHSVQQLNRWYVNELPVAIGSRAPDRHLTASELVQLVEWKLSYGKWRPRLLDYAKAASEQQVQEASRKAFSLLLSSSAARSDAVKPAEAEAAAPSGDEGGQKRKQLPQQSTAAKRARTAAAPPDADAPGLQDADTHTAAAASGQPSAASVKAALGELTVLKGVGPATASAALAAADGSGSTPYMGDEALQAACGGRDYTPKAYLQLLEVLRAKADWLRQQDPGGGWTAVLVERCLHAAALQEKDAPAAASAKPSRGAKASSKPGKARAAAKLAASVSQSCVRTARPFTHHRPGIKRNLATMAAAAPASEWLQQDSRRMLHAVYRVGDMQKHIDFYTKLLGMKLLRQRDIPEDKYTNAFLGYGPEQTNFAIELTYNYGVDSYDIGQGFGHFGVALPDVYATADKIKAGGGTITREAGPVKGGSSVIAFAKDPTGYMWELIQRPKTQEPLCQVMLRVGDLQRSIDYFTNVMGMQLLRTRDVPEYKYTLAFLGYGPEDDNCVLELTYNYGKTEYAKGNAYAQVALSTKDVYKTAEQIRAAGGTISREPGPVPGIGTKVLATMDPDGYKWVFVDEEDFNKELTEAAQQQ